MKWSWKETFMIIGNLSNYSNPNGPVAGVFGSMQVFLSRLNEQESEIYQTVGDMFYQLRRSGNIPAVREARVSIPGAEPVIQRMQIVSRVDLVERLV